MRALWVINPIILCLYPTRLFLIIAPSRTSMYAVQHGRRYQVTCRSPIAEDVEFNQTRAAKCKSTRWGERSSRSSWSR